MPERLLLRISLAETDHWVKFVKISPHWTKSACVGWHTRQITLISSAVSFRNLDKIFQGPSLLNTGHLSAPSWTAAAWALSHFVPDFTGHIVAYTTLKERSSLLQRSCPPDRQESRSSKKAYYHCPFDNVELKDENQLAKLKDGQLAKVTQHRATSFWFLGQDLNQKPSFWFILKRNCSLLGTESQQKH